MKDRDHVLERKMMHTCSPKGSVLVNNFYYYAIKIKENLFYLDAFSHVSAGGRTNTKRVIDRRLILGRTKLNQSSGGSASIV